MAWFLAGWTREDHRFFSASSRLNAGPLARAARFMPFFMPLNGAFFYSLSCNFESVTLYSDFQSVLLNFSAHLPYEIPKSFTGTRFLLNSLSDSKLVHLQSILVHSFLGNDLADTLAKVDATHGPYIISLSLSPLIFFQYLLPFPQHRISTLVSSNTKSLQYF